MDGSEIQRIPFNSYKDPESKQNGKKPRINFNYSPNIVRKSMPLNTKENKGKCSIIKCLRWDFFEVKINVIIFYLDSS